MTKPLGVSAEVKDGERRAALDPYAVAMFTGGGLKVLVEYGAGAATRFPDADYLAAGADLVSNVDEVWGADLVVKVKEPIPSEWKYFRPGLKLFGYLHFAAAPELARALQDAGVEAHTFETVSEGRGLPLLAPIVVGSAQVCSMRKGSVIVDLAIDQGGCIETFRPTSLSNSVYEDGGIIHYCATNVPGQFPRTASRALSAAIAPRVRQLALEADHSMPAGSLNVTNDRILSRHLEEDHQL